MKFKTLTLILSLVASVFVQSTAVVAQDFQESRKSNGWTYRLSDQSQAQPKYVGHQSGPDALKEDDEGMHPLVITGIVVGSVALIATIAAVVVASSIPNDPS